MINYSKFVALGFLLLAASFFLLTRCTIEQEIKNPKPNGKVIVSEKQNFVLDTIISTVNIPWGIDFLPNGDMLYTERSGKLMLLPKGSKEATEIKGAPAVKAKGQGGLLDIKLHPEFAQNKWVYLSYSAPDEPGSDMAHTALMRAKLVNNELTSPEVLFKGSPSVRTSHHYGSRIVFDGAYVFVCIGERGQQDMSQQLSTHMGKVIRLHHDGKIPTDNPFLNTAGAKPEIYSYGHRNPQGMVIEPATGKLWLNEHGPKGGDELNEVKKGANYGWPVITYGINYDGSIITNDTAKAGMEQPRTYWKPSIAPSGMAFAGAKYPGWKGNAFIGSLKFNNVERVEFLANGNVHKEQLLKDIGRIRVVKEGLDGYLYLGIEGKPGAIVRLLPANK